MSGRKSKNKGKAGERELGKILEGYLGGTFARSLYSGAYIGKSNSFRKETLGDTAIRAMKADLITPEHLPRMVIECKWYADLPIHNLIREGVPQIDQWFEELNADCDDGEYGFLAIKLNRKGWLVGFKKSISDKFKLDNFITYKDCIVTDLTSFLENNASLIKKLCA